MPKAAANATRGTLTRAASLLVLLFAALMSDAAAVPVDGPVESASQLRVLLVYGDLAGGETVTNGASLDRPHAEDPPPADPWFSYDKAQHFSFSLLITVGSQYAYVNKLSRSERGALPISMVTSASVGLAKELYDWQYGSRRYFSQRDMVANVAGILVAAGFILL